MPRTTRHSTQDLISPLLEKILMVVAIQATRDLSISQGARLLRIAGLDVITVAKILGTDPRTVSTLTTGVRAADSSARRPTRKKKPTSPVRR